MTVWSFCEVVCFPIFFCLRTLERVAFLRKPVKNLIWWGSLVPNLASSDWNNICNANATPCQNAVDHCYRTTGGLLTHCFTLVVPRSGSTDLVHKHLNWRLAELAPPSFARTKAFTASAFCAKVHFTAQRHFAAIFSRRGRFTGTLIASLLGCKKQQYLKRFGWKQMDLHKSVKKAHPKRFSWIRHRIIATILSTSPAAVA